MNKRCIAKRGRFARVNTFPSNHLHGTWERQIIRCPASHIATGTFKRFELEGINPIRGSEPVVSDCTLQPLRNAQGDVVFVVMEARDITQRRRAEEEVVRKNAELQALYKQVSKLDQLKSLFFATMNHELQTPLTLILGPTEALCQQPSLAPEIRQVLEVVARNGRLLLKLVNDLLEVSRFNSNCITPRVI